VYLVVGLMGNAGQVTTRPRKAVLLGLTMSLAANSRAQHHGNAVARLHRDQDDRGAAGAVRLNAVEDPAGPFGRPEEVAEVVAFPRLARAGYVTGQA